MSAAIEQTVMVDIYAWWFRYSLFAIHETQKKKNFQTVIVTI